MRNLVSVTLSFSLIAIGTHQAQAQTPQKAQQEEIYELITTAIHTKSSETALPVTVLAGDSLHDAIRGTLGDTLASQPGINNASFGPAVGQTVIRGQQGRRVMNLSNGIPNADASGNSADHAQTVEAILATSIEVLRGPSTLLYGGGAIGGVVNVIDRRIVSALPETPELAIETRHDTAADMNTAVGSLDFATGNFAWHFDGMKRDWNALDIPGLAIDPAYLDMDSGVEALADDANDTEGFIPNSGGESTAATAGLSWVLANGFIGMSINQQDNTYGLPPGAHSHAHEHEDANGPAEPEAPGADFVFIDMERTRYDLSGEWNDLASWAETVTYQLSHTDYAHAEIEGTGAIGTRYSNDSWQQRLQVTHTDTSERHGVIGLQYSQEEFAALGDESFIPVTDIDSRGVFVVEDFHNGPLTFELGARFNQDVYAPLNDNAPNRDFATVSFSGSSLWDVTDTATLGLALSRSQRAPSVEELYSNYGLATPEACVIHFATGSCEVGNVDFTEETSLNTDLTLYLDYGRFSATFTAFYNRFNDYIGQINTGANVDDFPVRAYRQDDARFTGIEVDANLELNAEFDLRIFGDTIAGNFDSNGDVPRMPSNRYGMELSFNKARWTAYASMLHATVQDQPGFAELPSAAWTRFDMGADYSMETGANGDLLLFVKLRNLTDEEIRLSTSYLRGFAPEAGRSLETGVRYRY